MHTVLKLGDPFEDGYDIDLCISGATRMEIMKSRPGADDFLQSSVAQKFVLEQMHYFSEEIYLDDLGNGKKEKAFVARLVKLGAQPKNLGGVYYYKDHDLKTLESFGIIAGKIPKDDFLRELKKEVGQSMYPILIWDKQTFNRLLAAGFPLDANDHIIVDSKKERVLYGLLNM